MKSMTGFANAEYVDEIYQIYVEIRSVNHRYKDFNIRLPKPYMMLEENVRRFVSQTVQRGHIDVTIKITTKSDTLTSAKMNEGLVKNYIHIVNDFIGTYPQIKDDVSVMGILNLPDSIIQEEPSFDMEALWAAVEPVMNEALIALDEKRALEGAGILSIFRSGLEKIAFFTNRIEEISDGSPKNYFELLKKHLSTFLNAAVVDENRIVSEMMVFADKIDITEEVNRVRLHLENFKNEIEKDGTLGKKLDFLVQEINREANTIATKSSNFDISILAVEIKNELEKIREQVQNVE